VRRVIGRGLGGSKGPKDEGREGAVAANEGEGDERARVGQVGGKVLGGVGDDGNGRCGRPVVEIVDLDEFGSAGSRKRQGEGPGGKGMGQGRRGGQGEKIGVEADALVDKNDVDGRQKRKTSRELRATSFATSKGYLPKRRNSCCGFLRVGGTGEVGQWRFLNLKIEKFCREG